MIPFTHLTNETREIMRAPRRVQLPEPALLKRLVPVRIRPAGVVKPQARAAAPAQEQVRQNGRNAPALHASSGFLNFPVVTGQAVPKKNGFAGQSNPLGASPADPQKNAGRAEEDPFAAQADPVEAPRQDPFAAQPQKDAAPREDPRPAQAEEARPAPAVPPPAHEAAREETKPAAMAVEKPQRAASLSELLEANPGLPPQSVLLGVCQDGLPLALDLNDPSPGALLSIGDERKDQLGLLRTVVESIASRNIPRAFQFLVFSYQPASWQEWIQAKGFDRHCLGIIEAQEDAVCDWVLRLADWTEQRRLGQRSGPPVLLVVDSLSFLPKLAYDIRLNFDWMVKEGPQAQVWTLAAISTDLVASLGNRFLRPFNTRILGRPKTPDVYTRLAYLDEQQSASLDRSGKFMVQAGETWLEFHLPAA